MRPAPFIPCILAGLVLLSGCTTAPPADERQAALLPLYEQRAEIIEGLPNWSLEGRLAVSDERDGGSGHLNWQQWEHSSLMDFHGALGRGAWRLQADAAGAELVFADGSVFHADTVADLVQEQIGWHVPVDPLTWWVRGLAAPGRVEGRVLDEAGRPSRLRQAGWNIEYGQYGIVNGLAMPLRITARREDRTVKLAIRRWQLSGPDE
jgi:outer membrane lipoprotein LolB